MEDAFLLNSRPKPQSDAAENVLKLQLACLENAIRTIVCGGYKDAPQYLEQDILWITGQTPSQPNFSFNEICESAGYDPDAWRERLLQKADEVRDDPSVRRTLRNVTRPRAKGDRIKATR